SWDESLKLREQVLRLLRAAENTLRFSVKDAASDDLRRAVDIAVKDGFFGSWPIYVIGALASLLFVGLFGGTWLGSLQFSGLQKSGEEARQTIERRSDAFKKEIDDKSSHLDDIIRNAVKAQDPRVAAIIDKAVSDQQRYLEETKR